MIAVQLGSSFEESGGKIGIPWAEELARCAGSIHLRVFDSWWNHLVKFESLGGFDEASPNSEDHRVGRPHVLNRAVEDPAHALGDGLVLVVDYSMPVKLARER